MTDLHLVPVGVVHSPVRSCREMPSLGMDGEIELFPSFADALEGMEGHSHLFVIGWMHRADRTVKRAVPRKISPDLPAKGVFSIRSPSRPNPLSLTIVELRGIREGRILDVSFLDLIDGTPVIDLKPYQPGTDSIFSAKNPDRSVKIGKISMERYRDDLIREAIGFHGEYCPAVAVAVRMMIMATRVMGGDLARDEITCSLGPDPCINDALMGITGARFGNGRLIIPEGWPKIQVYCLSGHGISLEFGNLSIPPAIPLVNSTADTGLFSCKVNTK